MIKFIIVLTTLLLTGCSGLLTSNQSVDQFYTVNAIYYETDNENDYVDSTIVIQNAGVSKGLEGHKIMLMHSPQRLDYYAHARWSNILSAMVQTSLVESFENSEALLRVGSDRSGIRPDYLLLLEIQDFQAEYQEENQPPVVHIKIVAKLVHYPDRTLAASLMVETYQQAKENELSDIIVAFDEAFAGAQAMLIEETLDYFE